LPPAFAVLRMVGALRASAVALGLVAVCWAAAAQEQPRPEGDARRIARIPAVTARHGMVASKEAHATRIGVQILREGGNAVDAAVAVGFALSVTSPRSAALGGGGFMLVYLAAQKKTVAIDYREMAPLDTPKDVFLDAAGRPDPKKSRDSGVSVGVPGTVAGLAYAEAHYGSGKFTLAQLLAPAVQLARDGIPVAGDLEDSLKEAGPRLARFPSSRQIFFGADGRPLRGGDILRQPDLAKTLEAIGGKGASAFYTGPIATDIAAAVRSAGGHMSPGDLSSYRVAERKPVRGDYRGHEIVSMPPPSSGGVSIVEILNILEGYPLRDLGANSAQSIHLMAEAMKLAFADRSQYLGDPDFVSIPVAGLTSKAYAAHLRKGISWTRARPASDIRPGDPAPYESDQTTHFSVVDAEGNAVANTYTLNLSFGVGLTAAGTGVVLNDELDDFAAAPGAPNVYGLVGGEKNAPGPRKRPLSSMSPTLVFKDGELELVTGSPGGPRIISTVVEILSDVIDHGYNVAEADDAPRFHDQWMPDVLDVERGISPDTIRLLKAMGHRVRVQAGWGAAATIARTPDGLLTGSADPRERGTLAAGY
jgi:gamma-glutamyltranspeptidase/glutathione hydrolase